MMDFIYDSRPAISRRARREKRRRRRELKRIYEEAAAAEAGRLSAHLTTSDAAKMKRKISSARW